MQLNTFAGLGYSRAIEAIKPIASGAAQRGPAEAFTTAASDFMETMRAGEKTVVSGLAGKADAQSVVQALAQTELALQTAVAVRDKVVEAYQEILRMPV